jgi:hypothetical protein
MKVTPLAIIGLLASTLPGLAQCNPLIPLNCGPTDPILLQQQQERRVRDDQQSEQLRQSQQLQQIDRQNLQRYQQQERSGVLRQREFTGASQQDRFYRKSQRHFEGLQRKLNRPVKRKRLHR